MKSILITGVHGQVGYELALQLNGEYECTLTDVLESKPDGLPSGIKYSAVDLTNLDSLRDFLNGNDFDFVVNPAAYTNTDKAESEPELAQKINVDAPEVLADYCGRKNIPLIHFSTDYVYDGKGDHFRTESETTNPLSVYGQTKLDGEKKVLEHCPKSLIFRTAWVYSYRGKNFFNTMAHFGKEREQLKVIGDQIGAPTSATFLAKSVARVLNKIKKNDFQDYGVYHLVNREVESWHAFAEEIFKQLKAKGLPLAVKEVVKITSEEWPTPIERPKNSRLDCSKFENHFDSNRPTWQEGLSEIVEKYLVYDHKN